MSPGIYAWSNCGDGGQGQGALPWAAIAPARRRMSFHDGIIPHAVGPTRLSTRGTEAHLPRLLVAVKMLAIHEEEEVGGAARGTGERRRDEDGG